MSKQTTVSSLIGEINARNIILDAAALERAEITQADLRHEAPLDYLAVIVELDGREYSRLFEAEATDDRIMENFEKDWANWRVI